MNCIKCKKETDQEIHLPSPEKHTGNTTYYIPVPLCLECIEKLKAWFKES